MQFFCTNLLEAVFVASIPVFVAVSINFLPCLSPNFLAIDKKPYPFSGWSRYFKLIAVVFCFYVLPCVINT